MFGNLPDLTIISAFLNFLLIISLVVNELVEQFKPWLVSQLPKDADGELKSPDVYLGLIYLLRLAGSVAAVVIVGGYATLIGLLPWFAKIPEAASILVAAFTISFGSGFVQTLKKFVESLTERLNSPPASE